MGDLEALPYQHRKQLISASGLKRRTTPHCFIQCVVQLIMKIKSISEAFSIQPITLSVVDMPTSLNPENSIKEIKLEVMDETTNVYVGYNFDGKKLFEYIAKSVNVHYL